MSSKSAWRIGSGVALAGVLVVGGGGLSGVPLGTRTFRIVYEGAPPPTGHPILEQTWQSDAPWHGGLLSTSTFEVDGDASMEGASVVGRTARRRWAFYGQHIEEVVLGVSRGGSERDVLSFGSDADPNASPDICASAVGTDVARVRIFAARPPMCILYPESASEVEVTVDARAADSFFVEARGGPHRGTIDEDLPIAAGGVQVFQVSAGRLAGWGAELTDVSARLDAAAVPDALWQEVRAHETTPDAFTREAWQALFARVRTEGDPGWQLELHDGTLTVTAPPQAGSRVRLVVIGFADGDELAIVDPVPMVCVTAEAFAATEAAARAQDAE